MLHRFVLHNGEIRDVSEHLLSAGQVGLLSGWGVFTTLKVAAGVLFAFERHWARMARDAAALHVTLPGDPDGLRRRLHDLVEANGAHDSTMRLAVVRNLGGMWADPQVTRPSDVIALTADTKDWGEGARLTYTPYARYAASRFAGAKILSWAMNLTWLEEAKAKGFDEVILLNERGEVAECTSANVFVAKGDRVWTPPLASGCLPGVTRELLLSAVRVPEFPVEERTLFPADLESAGEVFITSTTRGLLPVTAIDGHAPPRARAAVTALQAALSSYVAEYVAKHRDR